MATPFIFPDEQMRRALEKQVRDYEERYEMSSVEMGEALTDGTERETVEKLRWMFDHHVLEYLKARTPTTGTPGTATESSMINDLLRTVS